MAPEKIPKWTKNPKYGFMSLAECLDHFSDYIEHEVKAQIWINEEFEESWKGTEKEIEQLRADEIHNFKQEIRDNTFTYDPELTYYFSDEKIAVDGWFNQ